MVSNDPLFLNLSRVDEFVQIVGKRHNTSVANLPKKQGIKAIMTLRVF